jgi:hypothetical protein
MRHLILAVATIATTILGACATTDTKTEPREEREVVTGSNIPRRDRTGPSEVTVMSREALEAWQKQSGSRDAPRN